MRTLCHQCSTELDIRGQCPRCGSTSPHSPDEPKTLPPDEAWPGYPANGLTPAGPGPAPDEDSRLDALLDHIAHQSHFEERYTISDELARGGMGSISRAYDHILRRQVAIKMMAAGRGAVSAALRGQFLKEARVGGRLLHPNVLPVFDVGVNREHQLYFTMRLVDGASLQACLGALDTGVSTKLVGYPLRKLVTAFLGVCRGIDYAHQNGVIHLDLKPANILMSGFQEVFVIDWGLARVDDVDDTEQLVDLYRQVPNDQMRNADTGTGPVTGAGGSPYRVVGTLGYMASEQAQGMVHMFGPWTDVYGLGGILHFILYGKPPNQGASPVDTMTASLQPKARGILRPGILPRGQRIKPEVRDAIASLETITLKALEPDAGKRHSSADELVVELEEWLASAPV